MHFFLSYCGICIFGHFGGFELVLALIYSYRSAISLSSLDPFHLWTWLHDYTFHVFIYNLLKIAMMIFFVWDSYITSFLPTWFTQPKHRYGASPLIRSTSNGQSVITGAHRNYKCSACSALIIKGHYVMGKNVKSLLSFILNKQAACIVVFLFYNKNSPILKSTEILLYSWFSTWKRNSQSGVSSVLPLPVKQIFEWHLKNFMAVSFQILTNSSSTIFLQFNYREACLLKIYHKLRSMVFNQKKILEKRTKLSKLERTRAAGSYKC